MLLERQDAELLFKLHRTLMFFVNRRLQVIPGDVAAPEAYGNLSPEERAKVHDAFLANIDLIESFVAENPARLSAEELDIVHSWRHLVAGKFYVFRDLKPYTVFLSSTTPVVAYGVVALSQPFEELIGPNLPVIQQTILLPFKGRIVYDGLLVGYGVTMSFGPGVRRMLNDSFKEAKERYGIVTSLPMSEAPIVPKTKPKAKPRPKANPKEKAAEALTAILGLIEPFCRDHLNEEYAVLCRRLAEKLDRKRPSPLSSGAPSTWASGIVRTIGWVNFLHDKSQTPHMRLGDVDAAFGISESSGAAKLATIRKLLKINQMDPAWTLPSKMDDNPMIWMLQVNGIVVDVRNAPRELQEIAFNKGLIPYIPADR